VPAALVVVLSVIFAPLESLGGEMRRLQWESSIYVDSKGVGLNLPEGVACESDALVVADSGNARILRYSVSGETVTGEAEVDLPKAFPIKVRIAKNGDVYFLDARERRIGVIGADGEIRGFLKPKGLPFKTQVTPRSFDIDKRGLIYLLDIFSERVFVVDGEGQFVRQIRFPDEYGFLSDLTVDSQGNVFVVDSVAAVVFKAAGDSERLSALTESLKAFMNFPKSLAVDGRGVIYLVDQNGSGLALVGYGGDFLGRKLSLGWNQGGLYYPSDICISETGNAFIADRNNSRVQVFKVNMGGSGGGSGEARAPE